jgi:lipoprotein-anchoring transpeptidase ErfK/SrfK
VASIVTAGVVLSGVGAGIWSNNAASQASATYQQNRQVLSAELATAAKEGYTQQDLKPVTSKYNELSASNAPWWIPSQAFYFQSQGKQTAQLEGQLKVLEQQLLTTALTDAGKQVDAAKAEAAQAQQIGASDGELLPLQQRLSTAAADQGGAKNVRDYRSVTKEAQGILADATTLFTQTQQENQVIQQAAQQLIAQNAGNLGAIQAAGIQALSGGRNDASLAAYMNRLSPFKGYAAIQSVGSRLEKYAALIGSGDVNASARGAAGVQRYAGQIHTAVFAGLPAKAVIISWQGQHLWAYQNGQVVMETPVTTGVRGVTTYGTDFGAMKVLHKDHPWKMHSPFPKGSVYWYPDTVVQYATFFTNSGESIHDAAWEPDSLLGPGSQYNASTRSHGCVHVPFNDAVWMYNFADVGMPVVVYPADGSPVANQLSLTTTNDQGEPLTPA